MFEQFCFNLGRCITAEHLPFLNTGEHGLTGLASPAMQRTADLNRKIVEDVYCEALMLADEARSVFDLTPVRDDSDRGDQARLALSVEGLRTTTRIMHVLAWLLNHRAFYAGELSEFQLRRHSKLPPDRPSEPENLKLLEPETHRLVIQSRTMHQRIARLDAQWRERYEMQPAAVLRLRERLDHEICRADQSCS